MVPRSYSRCLSSWDRKVPWAQSWKLVWETEFISFFWRDAGRRGNHSLFSRLLHSQSWGISNSSGPIGAKSGVPKVIPGEEKLQKHRTFQWVERRQDKPVAGVKACEHLFSRAGVASDLASYKLGFLCILICIHASVGSCHIFSCSVSKLSMLPLSSHASTKGSALFSQGQLFLSRVDVGQHRNWKTEAGLKSLLSEVRAWPDRFLFLDMKEVTWHSSHGDSLKSSDSPPPPHIIKGLVIKITKFSFLLTWSWGALSGWTYRQYHR